MKEEMLNVENLINILQDLSSKEIGCTYEIKNQFGVSLNPLEILGLVKIIRTKIPPCDDHCQLSNDCKWMPIFGKKRSKSKFRLTKDGESLLEKLTSDNLSREKMIESLQSHLMNVDIVDFILTLLMDNESVMVEQLTSRLLQEANLKLQVIRTTIKDLLDLMVSLNLISIFEGVIIKNASRIIIK